MLKKLLIGIGTVILLYVLASFIFPNYIGIPLSAYNARTEWKKHEQNLKIDKDSISVFPKSIGIINDYGKVFSESQRAELNELLYNYEIETTRQIVVVTIESINPYQNIQEYATDLGNEWGIGNAEKDNGLTIVVCNPCKQIGIATGLGTELILTDKICKSTIENTIIPEFKSGKFYAGIKKGVIELIEKWN